MTEQPRDPWREREERADRWAGRQADKFADRPVRTGLGWLVRACLALVAIAAVGAVIFGTWSWIAGWGDTAKRVTGAENTERQAFALRDDYRSLEATAGNVCDARSGAGSPDDPSLVERPDFAYRATYRRIKADYDRRMDNAFEAGWVRRYPFLRDLPRQAPTLTAMTEQVC